MGRILAATDLTGPGNAAVQRAAEIAKTLDLPLCILHVLRTRLPADLAQQFTADTEARVAALKHRIEDSTGVTVDARCTTGAPWHEILDAVERGGATLLVIGPHDFSDGIDLLHGTTVERIGKLCDVALLLARGDPSVRYRKVLMATDFSLSSRNALVAALKLAPKAEVRVLHAHHLDFAQLVQGASHGDLPADERSRLSEQAKADMQTFLGGLEAASRRLTPVLVEGRPGAAIRREIKADPPDLLALGTHGRSRLSEALLGSLARDMLSDPPCDVLVVPPHQGP